ncbi:MAG: SdpI family protein [Acidobacteriota bacterium]
MTHTLNTASIPFLVPAVIFVLISVPLVLGMVPRNRFYGIRTKKTLSDDRVWYAVNKLGGRLIIFSSLIYLAATSLLPYSKSSSDSLTVWSTHILAFVVPLLGSLCLIRSYSRKL